MIFQKMQKKSNEGIRYATGKGLGASIQFYDIGFKPDYILTFNYINNWAIWDAEFTGDNYSQNSRDEVDCVQLGFIKHTNIPMIGQYDGDSFTDKGFYAKIATEHQYIALKRYDS